MSSAMQPVSASFHPHSMSAPLKVSPHHRYPRTPSPSPPRSSPLTPGPDEDLAMTPQSLSTIKMEDLEQRASSVEPQKGDGKSTKKRKSWGQILPEPKTNLPPRKRAKTADEKEQRRIERVKRNRLAAHNSRERKRQEVDCLQLEKQELEDRLRAFEQSNKQMAAKLAALGHPQTSLPELPTLSTAPRPVSLEKPATMTPEPTSNTINPRHASFPSPESSSCVDSPVDTTTQPSTPTTDVFPLLSLGAGAFDKTQHSAAMLCDLQCLSNSTSRPRKTSWASLLSFLLHLPRSSTTSPLKAPSSTLKVSATRRRRQQLARARLLRRAFSSPSSTRPSSPSMTSAPLARSLLGLSACTPTQAQQLLLATGCALQRRPGASSAAVDRILGVSRARYRGAHRFLAAIADNNSHRNSSLDSSPQSYNHLVPATRRAMKQWQQRLRLVAQEEGESSHAA